MYVCAHLFLFVHESKELNPKRDKPCQEVDALVFSERLKPSICINQAFEVAERTQAERFSVETVCLLYIADTAAVVTHQISNSKMLFNRRAKNIIIHVYVFSCWCGIRKIPSTGTLMI